VNVAFGEQLAAHASVAKDVHGVLLPLLLDDCKLTMQVQSLVKLDFRDPTRAAWDAQVERQPVGAAEAEAAPHAAVGAEVAAARVAAVLRQVEAAVPVVAEAAPRQEEALAAQVLLGAAALPSAAASVFRRGRLRPAVAAPRPAARSVREKRGLRNVSRSARSSQAAQDEVWSWRSRFLESLL